LECPDEGPEFYVQDEADKATVAALYEPVRVQVEAFEAGGPGLPDPAREARIRFIALEEGAYDDDSAPPEDPDSFRSANAIGVQLGLAIRTAEGDLVPEPPEEFLDGVDLQADEGTAAVQLRELADWHARDFTGPPDEHGYPGHTGPDPLVLALFSENENVFKAMTFWAEEYVRLKSMRKVGIAIVMDRTKAVRFGYLLGCYLALVEAST
jgi:hypothetical protein